jgi:hypothetical protein
MTHFFNASVPLLLSSMVHLLWSPLYTSFDVLCNQRYCMFCGRLDNIIEHWGCCPDPQLFKSRVRLDAAPQFKVMPATVVCALPFN